jgi:hypothetical protein
LTWPGSTPCQKSPQVPLIQAIILLTRVLANFGLVGNGRLYILGLTADGIQAEKWYRPLPAGGRQKRCSCVLAGSIRKTPSTIRHGQKHTRTRSLWRVAMGR